MTRYPWNEPVVINQKTVHENDSTTLSNTTFDIKLRDVVDYAKQRKINHINLLNVNQSGPGKSEIENVYLNLNISNLCSRDELFDPSTYECVSKKELQPKVSCGKGTVLHNSTCIPSKKICEDGYILKDFVCGIPNKHESP